MKIKRLEYIPIFVAIILLPTLFLLNSCKHDGIPADQMKSIYYADVEQIFNTCAECHKANGVDSNYDFTTYTNIINTGGIVKSNAAKSKAYQSMISTIQIMPPNNPLTTTQRTLVWLWIEQGAKEKPAN